METLTSINLSLLAIIAIVLPLLSFLWIILFSKPGKGTGLAIFNAAAVLPIAIILFSQIWNKQTIHEQVNWFTVGTTEFKAGLLLNNLSILMLLLISFISLLVHIYSVLYMKGEVYLHRYWAYLGLFCFSMMALVIADNLLLVYMFWELVGFSSYLLIGFWFTRDAAIKANKKAFIINRIGDLGFLAGIMILFTQFQTLDITKLFSDQGLMDQSVIEYGIWISGTHHMPAIWLTIAGLASFFGAAAKSAQFPLHTWLPDAMEGPTSVSSLIHAATMVAAGVFLIARVYPVFDATTLMTITIIGSFTAFMAATIALVQNDIKKILAYSTISQLGFMMLAMGTGAYAEGVFHLATHAFFKCLLFLAAGAIIHELHHVKDKYQLDFDHQDIRNMGGLRKFMPVTFLTMVAASLAIIGLPLSSGYLSKDAILISSFEWANRQDGIGQAIPYLAMLTSWLTTFYIARLVFKVFFGELRIKELQTVSIHESPLLMRVPLIVLAIFCLFPVFSLNPLMFEDAWILNGFRVLESLQRVNMLHTIVPATVNMVGLLIIWFAYTIYGRKTGTYFNTNNFISRFAKNRWYFDEVYQMFLIKPFMFTSRFSYTFDRIIVDGVVHVIARIGTVLSIIADWFDCYIIDGFVNFLGSISKSIGNFARRFQSGGLQHYLITMLFIVLTFFIVKYFSQPI